MRRAVQCLLAAAAIFAAPCAYAGESAKPLISVKSMKQMRLEGATLQTLDYSCGPASLVALLHGYFKDYHYGEPQLVDEMLLRMDEKEYATATKEGFSMLNLKQLAERLGYVAHGVKLPITAAEKLKGPIIILLKTEESNHFVVLKGAKAGRAFITDPARGHLRVPLWELARQWNGESLIIGRKDVGLPTAHVFSLPTNNSFAPEEESVRLGRRMRPMKISNYELYRLPKF